MGNCDTHVFLGSNSFKTVEYFSKALGEKTISRDSLSVNRDKDGKKTGTGKSDQLMGRALMTPDELRRMDNDLCIIYEKGLKPVKAKKYYYFETSMAKKLAQFEMSHNDFNVGDRGEWRKFNPNNRFNDDDEEKQQDLKVDSLDDLFEDDFSKNTSEKENKEEFNDNLFALDTEDNELDFSNDRKLNEAEEQDLQKELEAKFDELFGPIDDEE